MTYNNEEKMNSLEALKELKENAEEICEWELDRLNIIEKDLEILEIIKKWSFIQESYKEGYGPYTKFQCIIHTIGMEEDFKKVKEWIEE